MSAMASTPIDAETRDARKSGRNARRCGFVRPVIQQSGAADQCSPVATSDLVWRFVA
jgi:hypothetical protein